MTWMPTHSRNAKAKCVKHAQIKAYCETVKGAPKVTINSGIDKRECVCWEPGGEVGTATAVHYIHHLVDNRSLALLGLPWVWVFPLLAACMACA